MKTQLKQNQIPKIKKSNSTELTQKFGYNIKKKKHCSIFWPKKLKINHTTLPMVDLVSICRIWCWSVKKKKKLLERELDERDSLRRESYREEEREREIEKREEERAYWFLREWEARELQRGTNFFFFFNVKDNRKTIISKIVNFFY